MTFYFLDDYDISVKVKVKGEVKALMQKALQCKQTDFCLGLAPLKSPIISSISESWIFKLYTSFCFGTFEVSNKILFESWMSILHTSSCLGTFKESNNFLLESWISKSHTGFCLALAPLKSPIISYWNPGYPNHTQAFALPWHLWRVQ